MGAPGTVCLLQRAAGGHAGVGDVPAVLPQRAGGLVREVVADLDAGGGALGLDRPGASGAR